MPHYLIQAAYTAEAWARLVKNPEDRTAAIRQVMEAVGGKLEACYFAFGEYDVVLLVEGPDNVSTAAASIAAAAGGALKAIKTTPLMTMQEGVEAMRKAGTTGYRAPGQA